MGHKAKAGYNSSQVSNHITSMSTDVSMQSVGRAIRDFVVDCSLPLSVVENSRFRELVERLNLSASRWIPSRTTLMRDITTDLSELMQFLREEIMPRDLLRCSFSCDIWTDRRFRSYLGVTASWIDISDGSFQPRDAVVAFLKVRGHDGEELKSHMVSVLTGLALESPAKVHSITTDNATSNDSLKGLLGSSHLPCVAHSLHLAIKDVQDEVDVFSTTLHVVRSVVRWWRARFSTLVKTVTDSDGKVVLGPLRDQKLLPLPPMPPREVRTRWSSTLALLVYLQRDDVRAWFDYVQDHPVDLKLIKEKSNSGHGQRNESSSDNQSVDDAVIPATPPKFDWFGPEFNVIIDLFQLLEPLGRVTKLVQSASTPTLASAWMALSARLRKWDLWADFQTDERKPRRRTTLERSASRATHKKSSAAPSADPADVANLDYNTVAAWERFARHMTKPRSAVRARRPPSHLRDDFLVDDGEGGYVETETGIGVDPVGDVVGFNSGDLDDADTSPANAARRVEDGDGSDGGAQGIASHVVEGRRLIARRLGDHLLDWVSLKSEPVALAVFLSPVAFRWLKGMLADDETRVSASMKAAWQAGMDKAEEHAREYVAAALLETVPVHVIEAVASGETLVSDDEPDGAQGDGPALKQATPAPDPVDAYLGVVNANQDAMPVKKFWAVHHKSLLAPLAARAHAALASSAASERLFSVSGYVGRGRRLRLTSANLSTLSILKANEMWLEEWRKVQRARERSRAMNSRK